MQVGQYLVLLTGTDKARLIRIDEFMVPSQAPVNQTQAQKKTSVVKHTHYQTPAVMIRMP